MERIPDVSNFIAEPADVAVEDAGDRITLRRRRFGPVRARLAGLVGAAPDFTVHLDALGTAAWRLLDGQRTVGAVRQELQRRFPDVHDVAPRLGKFIGTLASHRMIRLR